MLLSEKMFQIHAADFSDLDPNRTGHLTQQGLAALLAIQMERSPTTDELLSIQTQMPNLARQRGLAAQVFCPPPDAIVLMMQFTGNTRRVLGFRVWMRGTLH